VYEHTGRSPIIIPVLNIIASKISARSSHAAPSKTTVQLAAADQQRFQEMRARLLGQDQTD